MGSGVSPFLKSPPKLYLKAVISEEIILHLTKMELEELSLTCEIN